MVWWYSKTTSLILTTFFSTADTPSVLRAWITANVYGTWFNWLRLYWDRFGSIICATTPWQLTLLHPRKIIKLKLLKARAIIIADIKSIKTNTYEQLYRQKWHDTYIIYGGPNCKDWRNAVCKTSMGNVVFNIWSQPQNKQARSLLQINGQTSLWIRFSQWTTLI